MCFTIGMFTFIAVIEGLFNLHNYIFCNSKVKYGPRLYEQETTDKWHGSRSNNISHSRFSENFSNEAKKSVGFPINSDFGWLITTSETEEGTKSSLTSESLAYNSKTSLSTELNAFEGFPLNSDLNIRTIVPKTQERIEKSTFTNERLIQSLKENKKSPNSGHRLIRGKHKENSPKGLQLLNELTNKPHWLCSESQLLEALVLCARDDPDASQFLALQLNETDDEKRLREMKDARLQFLQATGDLRRKLNYMIEEARCMRLESDLLEIEMKQDDTKLQTLHHEAQNLMSQFLEDMCSGNMQEIAGIYVEIVLAEEKIKLNEWIKKRRRNASFVKGILRLQQHQS